MNGSRVYSASDLEEVYAHFEQAWQVGTPQPIEDCLRATTIPRSKLLRQLIHLDLEYRLQAEQPARLEDYVGRFPELNDDIKTLLELLETECRHRREFGQPPAQNEYRDRFPCLREHLFGTPLEGLESQKSGEPSAPSESWLPQTIGRYRVLQSIEEGGMSEIIRVQDEDFHRHLAMKVPKPNRRGDRAATLRFLREARITGHLQHPGIPPVLEMGQLPDGRPHFIMKLIEGQSLKVLLRARQALDERQTYFLGVFDQVCLTVAYAHSHGIIHRDLKPDNVMVGRFGEVQVMDWGLAKELGAGCDAEATVVGGAYDSSSSSATPFPLDRTHTGTELGTPAYMAPEQARGQAGQIDRRCDVFGLGGVLCEILTGKPPFESLQQSRSCDISDAYRRLDASGADKELIVLAKSCLAADANDRPADAGAVGTAMVAYHALARKRAERRKLRSVLAVAAGVVLAVLGSAAASWWTLHQSAEQTQGGEAPRQALHDAERANPLEAPRPDGQKPAGEVPTDTASENPKMLGEALMDAQPKEFSTILSKLKRHSDLVLPILIEELDLKFPTDMPWSDERREKRAKRQVNAAIALLRLDRPTKVWPLLSRPPASDEPRGRNILDDPRVRSYLIDRMASYGVSSKAIIERFRTEGDVTVRRALVLSLGEFDEQSLQDEDRQRLLPELKDIYRNGPDPGLHAAVGWLLQTWKQKAWLEQVTEEWANNSTERAKRLVDIRRTLGPKKKLKWEPRWFVNSQRQTMVVLPEPGNFWMGSPEEEFGRRDDELLHQHGFRHRSYALSATPVTVEQFRRFEKEYQLAPTFKQTLDMPATFVDCEMAAAYCNWLSQVEGLEPCYFKDGEKWALNHFGIPTVGYRLPTEAELEFATRAEAQTSRCYGESDELLPKYAWIKANSKSQAWPVGGLRPNDLGFFDVHGNVSCWSLDSHRAYQSVPNKNVHEIVNDVNPFIWITQSHPRSPRGGSHLDAAKDVRSAARMKVLPGVKSPTIGFRIAKSVKV